VVTYKCQAILDMPTATSRDVLDLGSRLRSLRLEQRLSLRALARRTSFSPSFLSQVELGQASPSLLSLDRIAAALGLGLPALLSTPDGEPGPILRRKGDAALRSEWSRATAQSLLPAGADERASVVLVRLDPGGRTGKGPRPPAGKELVFCVSGRATLMLGSERCELRPGDSVFYDTAQAVVWRNDSSRPAELLSVTLGIQASGRKGERP
jgi:transcriptional regulator with XRE-family HTH domain